MAREIIVLGAGMVGVSVAWHLRARGHAVTLIDRREPGQETSFGNAGIIQREAVRPYAFPRDLATLLRVAPNQAVDIRYRFAGVTQAAGPLFRYWQHSAPHRHERIIPDYAALIARSLDTHAPLIAAAGAEHLIRREGYFELFRSHREMAEKCRIATHDAERFGIAYQALSRDELLRHEPQLDPDRALVGAIHWTQPWTARDPGALVAAYARSFTERGGAFVQATLQTITQTTSGWRVDTDAGRFSSVQLVIALGPWSAPWLASQGIKVPLFVKRGYHMHYGAQAGKPLNNWLLDREIGYLIAPMHAGIRLTTGAELAPLDAPPDPRQLAAAETVARRLFPLGERLDPEPWKGARPCLPDMKPVIGPAPGRPGLWLAFGHGHQGFTLGPVTGALLSQMMDGETPEIDMGAYLVDRF